MKTIFVVFSVLFVLALIYHFFIHDLIKNKGGKKPIGMKETPDYIPYKKKLPSESYSKDYSLYNGDVKLSINKDESNFIKTIVRTHRLVQPEAKNEVSRKEVKETVAEPVENQDIDFEGSALDSYDAHFERLLNDTETKEERPNLKDIEIVTGVIPNKNPINVADILQNHLENQLEIQEAIEDVLSDYRQNSLLEQDKNLGESEILIDFDNNPEIISDYKENILNFNPEKSNLNINSRDNFLDFDDLEYDETI